jgi:hypothetical protein
MLRCFSCFKSLFAVTLLMLGSTIFAGNPTFSITPIGTINYTRSADQTDPLTFQFTLTNNLNKSVRYVETAQNFPDLNPDQNNMTCAYPTTLLAAKASCVLAFTAPQPTLSDPNTAQSFTGSLRVIDAFGYSQAPVSFGVTVHPAGVLGHFSLSDTNISLMAGDAKTVTLTNTGAATITDFSVTVPSGLSNAGLGGTCLTATSLENNASCTLSFSVTATTSIGSNNVIFKGDGADNTPVTLTANIDGIIYATGDNHSYYKCARNSVSGTIDNCEGKNIDGITTSKEIVINPQKTKLYILALNGNTTPLYSCSIDQNADLAGCQLLNADVGLDDYVFNSTGDKIYQYNGALTTINICDVNQDNLAISNCTNANATFPDNVYAIKKVRIDSSSNRIYINYQADLSGELQGFQLCDINTATSKLINCRSIFQQSLGELLPSVLEVSSKNQIAIINGIYDNSIQTSPLSSSDGSFSHLSDYPISERLIAVRNIILSPDNQYLYISGNSYSGDNDKSIFSCAISISGVISNCQEYVFSESTDDFSIGLAPLS